METHDAIRSSKSAMLAWRVCHFSTRSHGARCGRSRSTAAARDRPGLVSGLDACFRARFASRVSRLVRARVPLLPGGVLPKRAWGDMTTAEFEALDKSRAIALLPVGAIEQHGPHLPVCVDAAINAGVLARALELLPEDLPLVVLPPVPYGKSVEHDDCAEPCRSPRRRCSWCGRT